MLASSKGGLALMKLGDPSWSRMTLDPIRHDRQEH
jgi:hypothetical protein